MTRFSCLGRLNRESYGAYSARQPNDIMDAIFSLRKSDLSRSGFNLWIFGGEPVDPEATGSGGGN